MSLLFICFKRFINILKTVKKKKDWEKIPGFIL